MGGVGEVLQTSNVGEERDDGNDLAMSVAQGEVGPRDQVGSVSLTQEEGSEGNTSSVWGLGHLSYPGATQMGTASCA